ncbi:MAG: hypothetical protein GXP26_09795, partial [Planctomycetes bacterium]|nr:hypothetical protein [Planctomycetota bacterium]
MMLFSFMQVLVQRLSSARTLVFALAVGLIVCLMPGKPAQAQVFLWNGGSLFSDDWNDAGNWTSFLAPPTAPTGGGQILEFNFTDPAQSTSNIDTDWTVTHIIFNDDVPAMTFTGNRLTLTTSFFGQGFFNNDNDTQLFNNSEIAFLGALGSQIDYDILATSGDLEFDANIRVDGNVALNVGGDNDVFFDGGIIQTGNFGSETMTVNKSGTGELRLRGDSTGIDELNINDGLVLLSQTNNPTVSPILDVFIDSNGTFDLNGNDADIGALTGSGSVDLGSGRLTVDGSGFSGVISGTGGITKEGGALMVLGGSNTYTGSTLINAGELWLVGAGRISDDSDVSISGPATFDLNGVSDTVDSIQGAGTIRLGGGTLTVDEEVGLRTFSGDILETGTFVKNGAATLTLSGNNTFDGELHLGGGTLAVSESNNLGDVGTNMVFFGGTLQTTGSFTNPRDVFVGPFNSGTFNVNGGTTLTQSGVLAGDSTTTLTKSGGGTLLLNANNTLSGDININEGIVALGGSYRLDGSPNITVLAGATFDLNDFPETIDALTGAGNVTLGTGFLGVGLNNGSGTFSGVISGSGGFAKIGTGIQTLSGNNTYTNETLVFEGTLRTSGTGRLSDLTDVEVFSGATFDLNDFGETIDTLAGAGNVTLGTGFLLVGANNGSDTFSGVISGSGGFGKIGTGIQTLSGNNTYTGSTTVGAGTLRLSGSNRLSDSTDVTVSSGATFDLNGFSDTIDALAGAGNVTLGGGNILTVGANNGSGTFSGNITETGQLFKTGSGTQTLTGTNTYENTFVNQGTLVLSGGGSISQNALITGSSNGSDGTTIVDGGSTTWSLNTNLFVGLAGTGQMNINNGATVTVAGDASVAEFVGADGTLNISSGGSNSTLDVANGIGIGGEVTLAGGTADV